MRLLALSFLIFCLSGCNGCQKKDPLESIPKKTMDMKEFEESENIPSALWNVIESNYKPLALDPEGQAVKEGTKEKETDEKSVKPTEEQIELLKKRPPLDPLSFRIYLIEKTAGILGGENWDLKFPVGGGYLDFRYFIPESIGSGTFFLKIKYDSPMDPKETKVYYLSNAKTRTLAGQTYGNGCHRYFDVSDYWNKAMKGEGLVLNTHLQRHLSLTYGTFYFVAPVLGKLRIGHLTIKDSRHHELSCDDE
jgi:hypothetical protein